jgi:protein arginine kinase activator
MYCTACQKAIATIVIMDVSAGNVTGQQHLCAACAEGMGVVQPKNPFKLSSEILEDLLGGMKDKSGEKPRDRSRREVACPGCGLTPTDFKVKGRLGCPRCYETFRNDLVPLLQRVHEASSHRGRLPGRAPAPEAPKPDALAELRKRLEDAIRGERYEEAARLRDDLRQLEKGEPGART